MNYKLHILFFKAFSNKTRLGIINLLKSKPLTVTEICKKLGFEQSRVSHNLSFLESCGFVVAERDGKWVKYSLEKKIILPIVKMFGAHTKKYEKKLSSSGESLKQILKQLNIELPEDHTCNCIPCFKLPQLVLTASRIRYHHTCGCNACVENFYTIIDAKPIIDLRENHTCTCKACSENQRNLAS